VLPGGCSGFKYSLNIEERPLDDDLVSEVNGVRVFVDGFSAQYWNLKTKLTLLAALLLRSVRIVS